MSSPSAAAVSVHVREVDHVPKVGLVSKLKGKFPKHDEDSTLFTLAGIRVLCVLQETTVNAAAVHGLYHPIRKVHNNKVSCQQDHNHFTAQPRRPCSSENQRLHHFEFEQAAAAAAGA